MMGLAFSLAQAINVAVGTVAGGAIAFGVSRWYYRRTTAETSNMCAPSR